MASISFLGTFYIIGIPLTLLLVFNVDLGVFVKI